MATEKEFDFFGKKESHPLADDLGAIGYTNHDYRTFKYPKYFFFLPIATSVAIITALITFLATTNVSNPTYKHQGKTLESQSKSARNSTFVTDEMKKEMLKDVEVIANQKGMSNYDKDRLQQAINMLNQKNSMDTFPSYLPTAEFKSKSGSVSDKELKKMEEFRAKLMANELTNKDTADAIDTLYKIKQN